MKNAIIVLLFFSSIAGYGQPFITTWKTDNPGSSNSTSITIPTTGGGYNYDVDWNNDGTFDQFGITGNVTHDFGVAGTYTIRIQGNFPRIYFNNGGDKLKIIAIDQWGNISWTNMFSAFNGASNLINNASDSPNFAGVTNLGAMFFNADLFTGDLSNWDVSTITDMNQMFGSADSFNGNIINWNVSNVTTMNRMFISATSFNKDISTWTVSKVTDMLGMFHAASSFNINISSWNVSLVTDMSDMLTNSGLSVTNYDNTLIGWENQGGTPSSLTLGANNLNFCNGETARTSLINTYGWTISGDVLDCSSLPVELVNFYGRLINDEIKLIWTTASELNNLGFEIQKSKNGIDWHILDFIQGNGTSSLVNEYEYIDSNPFSRINYYRLKQIDFDGVFEYSKVISVTVRKENEIEIYPNPTNGRLEIVGVEMAEIKIINSFGRVVKELIMSNGNIDISELFKGLYFISVKTEKGMITQRIIKE